MGPSTTARSVINQQNRKVEKKENDNLECLLIAIQWPMNMKCEIIDLSSNSETLSSNMRCSV